MSGTPAAATGWDALESWAPALFVAGGVSWLVAAGINTLIHFAGVLEMAVLSQVFVSGAMLLAMVGLVGLYPSVGDWRPAAAKAGLGLAALGAVGALVNVVWSVLSVFVSGVDVLEAEPPALIIVVVTGLLLLVAPLVFGGFALRAGSLPRATGGFLLAEAALMAFVVFGPTEALPRGVFLVGAETTHAVIFFGVGYTLRTGVTPTSRTEPAPA